MTLRSLMRKPRANGLQPTAADHAAALKSEREKLALAERREMEIRADMEDAVADPAEHRRLELEADDQASECRRLRSVVRLLEDQHAAAVKREEDVTGARMLAPRHPNILSLNP